MGFDAIALASTSLRGSSPSITTRAPGLLGQRGDYASRRPSADATAAAVRVPPIAVASVLWPGNTVSPTIHTPGQIGRGKAVKYCPIPVRRGIPPTAPADRPVKRWNVRGEAVIE